jgi:tyrosyl-tRNA synthetase
MSKVIIDKNKIKELLERGVEKVVDKKHLEKRLFAGEKLRVKLGLDPTGPKLHLGRAISLWKLRDFQDLGHQIVLIIGDFTAKIGDASDKDSERPMLTDEQIQKNLKDYKKQIGLILDLDKTEFHYNSEWLKKFNPADIIKLASLFTIQQIIQRRNFKERFETGKEIGLHETLYPLFQGYDSVAIKANVETGGYDQLFNLLAARDIQKYYGQPPQDIMVYEMLIGLDGRKMSTSWGNVITLTDSPNEQYGKIMSMKDELIIDYFRLCTRLSMKEVKDIEKSLKLGSLNPRDAKARLAREIVAIYHGKTAALSAEREFDRVFREKGQPTKIPQVKVKTKQLPISELLVKIKLAPSKSEAKRLIEQGGVKINGEVVKDWKKNVDIKPKMILQVGKRKFIKLK